jgi:hypothetical protein
MLEGGKSDFVKCWGWRAKELFPFDKKRGHGTGEKFFNS